ncbi:Hypothetical protein A7982_10592 [Minicystis rosea]|nr:Hypothetical protein A7982_10592 [Minicystis rosea]
MRALDEPAPSTMDLALDEPALTTTGPRAAPCLRWTSRR